MPGLWLASSSLGCVGWSAAGLQGPASWHVLKGQHERSVKIARNIACYQDNLHFKFMMVCSCVFISVLFPEVRL